jgi:hypothetical protein
MGMPNRRNRSYVRTLPEPKWSVAYQCNPGDNQGSIWHRLCECIVTVGLSYQLGLLGTWVAVTDMP